MSTSFSPKYYINTISHIDKSDVAASYGTPFDLISFFEYLYA